MLTNKKSQKKNLSDNKNCSNDNIKKRSKKETAQEKNLNYIKT